MSVDGYYSITMWKDVIFSGLLSLLVIELIKIIELKDNISIKIYIYLASISIVIALLLFICGTILEVTAKKHRQLYELIITQN